MKEALLKKTFLKKEMEQIKKIILHQKSLQTMEMMKNLVMSSLKTQKETIQMKEKKIRHK